MSVVRETQCLCGRVAMAKGAAARTTTGGSPAQVIVGRTSTSRCQAPIQLKMTVWSTELCALKIRIPAILAVRRSAGLVHLLRLLAWYVVAAAAAAAAVICFGNFRSQLIPHPNTNVAMPTVGPMQKKSCVGPSPSPSPSLSRSRARAQQPAASARPWAIVVLAAMAISPARPPCGRKRGAPLRSERGAAHNVVYLFTTSSMAPWGGRRSETLGPIIYVASYQYYQPSRAWISATCG